MHRALRQSILSILVLVSIASVAALGSREAAPLPAGPDQSQTVPSGAPPAGLPAAGVIQSSPVARAPEASLKIRIGALKGPTGIGMIYLFETPSEPTSGYELKVEAIASADAMAARIMSGELDAAVLPVNMAAKLYNAGLPYRLLAVTGNGMVKVVTTEPTIGSLEDLRGRRVYVAGQGATPEFLMRTVLTHAGIDPDRDVALVYNMPYPEMAAGVVSGKIPVAVLPEPFATMALRGNPGARVPFQLDAAWNVATGRSTYPMSVFVARSSIIDGNGQVIETILQAYEASIASVKSSPAAAGELVHKHDMGLTAAIAEAAIPRSAYTFVRAPDARTDVEALLTVFLKAAPASIGGKLPDAAFYATPGR